MPIPHEKKVFNSTSGNWDSDWQWFCSFVLVSKPIPLIQQMKLAHCESTSLWSTLEHPSLKLYPVAAFTNLRPAGIAMKHRWPHFSFCHTILQKEHHMLPTALSDIDEWWYSIFSPHSVVDGVSRCPGWIRLVLGISYLCQVWPLSSFFLHLSTRDFALW